jgi:hypothetical protein
VLSWWWHSQFGHVVGWMMVILGGGHMFSEATVSIENVLNVENLKGFSSMEDLATVSEKVSAFL